MKENRSIPHCNVIPELSYPDVGQAVDWLCDVFGFTLRVRIANHRAQLNVGECAVVVTERTPGASIGGHSVMVRVDDVNAHYEHARQRGARILRPPADHPYGERQYAVEDFAGHTWKFSQSIDDVDPASWGGEMGQL